VQNRDHFTTDYENHNVPTRLRKNVHLPSASLSIYQKDVHYSGVKHFNKVPLELKQNVEYPNKLKNYLVIHCFYSTDESFNE
jgi:hypothetical protein